MRFTGLKKFAGSLALGAVLVTGFASVTQAQDWRRDRWEDRRDRREDRWDRREDRWDRRDDRWDQRDDRYYRYDRQQLDKGFRDGLDRGQKDAKTRRVPTPENSSHYRKGNESYREGFRRGYAQGYRQYAYNGYGGYGRRW